MPAKPNPTPSNNDEPLTVAQVSGMVIRKQAVIDPKTKRPTGQFKEVPITADEVLSYKVYPHKVVVVTKDGQKFEAGK